MSDHSSFISPAAIQAIAHSLNITKLSDEAAKALSPDVDYRLREIIQDAHKFARHAKRTVLTVEDVNNALRLRNFEPVYGFGNKDPAKYVRAAGHPDICIAQDRELSFDQLLDEPLPRPPVDISLMPHWLFINGVQPAIPENAPISRPVAKRVRAPLPPRRAAGQGTKRPAPAAALPAPEAATTPAEVITAAVATTGSAAALASSLVKVQQPVQHVLSRELQLYFDKVVQLLKTPIPESGTVAIGGTGPQHTAAEVVRLQRAALASLATDPGLHPLAPYFTKFVADEVAAGLRSLPTLHMVLNMVGALLSNPDIKLEHYVHQLLPSVLTCLVAKSLGAHSLEDHWAVREAAAGLVKQVCARFSDPFFNVQPRISKTLLKAFLDPTKPLATHYGAVIGLAALGRSTVSLLLLPQLAPYLARLQPIMDDTSNAVRRAEAYRVHGALLDAVSAAVYERLVAASAASLPPPPSLPRRRPALKGAAAAADAGGDAEMHDAPQALNGGLSMGKSAAAAAAAAAAADGPGRRKQQLLLQQGAKEQQAGPSRQQLPEALEEGNEKLVHSILAESWREDVDLSRVLWALQQLFHEELLARMPSTHLTAYCL